jgi:hypothetical protein
MLHKKENWNQQQWTEFARCCPIVKLYWKDYFILNDFDYTIIYYLFNLILFAHLFNKHKTFVYLTLLSWKQSVLYALNVMFLCNCSHQYFLLVFKRCTVKSYISYICLFSKSLGSPNFLQFVRKQTKSLW